MKYYFKHFVLLLCTISGALIAQPTMPLSDFIITSGSSSIIAANGLCGTPKSASIIDGWFISVSSASNCGLNINATAPSNGHINYLGGLGGGLTYATFGSDDGSEFAIKQMQISVSTTSGTSVSMLYQGYKNGSPVSGATLTANTPSTTFPTTVAVTFSTITAFQDVDDIRVMPQSNFKSNYQIWNITIGTATPVVSCGAIEGFESLAVNSTSFTSSGRNFSLTPSGNKVSQLTGYGYLSSNKFIDNFVSPSGPNPNPCQIKCTNGTFYAKSLYLYPSTFTDGNSNTTSGVNVSFIGKLAGAGQFTYSPPASNFTAASYLNATNRGFSLVDFSVPGYGSCCRKGPET